MDLYNYTTHALRPAKTEETVSHRQKNNVKEAGTPASANKLCTPLTAVPTAVRNKVTKTVSEKQLLRNNSAERPSSYESPAPPPSPLLISSGLWLDA